MSKDSDEPPISLDEHRGMAAQVATEARRHSSAVEADQEALRRAQAEIEEALLAGSAGSWPEAAARAKYLLRRFLATPEARDPRLRRLIDATLKDFRRLAGESESGEAASGAAGDDA